MSKKLLLCLGILVAGAWPAISYGGVFVGKGEAAETKADVNDDLYIGGNSVTVGHRVQDDLFAGANSVEVTGAVGQDIYAAGNSVRIESEVGDDVFAAGNSVRVVTDRVDDIFTAGNTVEIVSKDEQGSVYAAGQKIMISGQVAGSVRATGETVVIKSGTKIGGDLLTFGPKEPILEDNVAVGGQKRHMFEQAKRAEGAAGKSLALAWLVSVAVWVVVGLVLLYVWPSLTHDTVSNVLVKGGRSLGIGFLWLAAIIPLCLLLLTTIVGWPLAIIAGLGSLTVMMIANALGMVVVGAWVMQKVQRKQSAITWQQVAAGTVVVKALQIIPVIGWLINLAVFVLALGALGMSLWERLRAQMHEPTDKIEATGSEG